MSLVENIFKFKFYLFILLFIFYIKSGYCSPAVPPNVSREFYNNNNNINNGPFDSDIWSLVDRQPGLPDIILPSLCPSPCVNLFKAQMANISGAECACRCSKTSPGFVQSIGQCSSKLEECQNPVRFEGNVDSSLLPLFTLPAPQGVIGSKANILWHEAKIKLIPSVGARCNISGVYYLKNDRLWQEGAPSLFYIDWFDDNARLYWNGTILEAKQLEGTIIQLKLDCFGHSRNAHCLSFRIAGQTGPLVTKRNNSGQSTTGYQGRFETIVIIFLIILIFLVIFGAIVSWQICWGLKKSELISNIQMRILYQMKQDKDKESLENNNNNNTAHRYQSIARNSHNHNNNLQSNEEIIDETKSGEMVQHGIVKRKLFFSAEFFEPHFMMNPPPMAEQFLHDLRKMIDLAKHRIHGKKHIPQLVSIPEETKEHYQPYMELQNRPDNLQVTTPTIYASREEENSPKSVKSCDSGRESMRDASSTESVASSTDSNAPKARSPIPSLTNGGVKNLVNEFEPPKNESRNRKAMSRIPVITGFAKSLKLPAKSNVISIAQAKTFAEVPPLPPRNRPTSPLNNINHNNNNNNNCTTPPPPLPSSPPPQRISAANGIPQPVGHARRKTYAVFPTDPMLKKSLPRRTKKKPSPPAANGIIETNM